MVALRYRPAVLADGRQLVALDDCHVLVGVGEHSGGGRPATLPPNATACSPTVPDPVRS